MQSTSDNEIKNVSVFDFDGTAINGQSGELFSTYLFRRGFVGVSLTCRLIWWGVRYILHLPYRQAESRELVFSALDGLDAETVDQIMCDFHDEVLEPRYRESAFEEVERRHEEGDIVLLASATFDTIANRAAEHLGADGAVATRMERDADGNYTGRVDGLVVAGDQKYPAVVHWCDENLGVGKWRLESAYADHHTDEDLLNRADEPYAVTPGATMRLYARRHGWPILEWET